MEKSTFLSLDVRVCVATFVPLRRCRPSIIKTRRLFNERQRRLFHRPATRRDIHPSSVLLRLSLPPPRSPLPPFLPPPSPLSVNHWWRLPTVAQQSRPTEPARERRHQLDDDDDSPFVRSFVSKLVGSPFARSLEGFEILNGLSAVAVAVAAALFTFLKRRRAGQSLADFASRFPTGQFNGIKIIIVFVVKIGHS